MRVLVTGATGFVGTCLCAHLVAAGHEVVGLARTAPKLDQPGVRAVQGDVVTGEGLRPAMQDAEAVIHLVGIIREVGGASFEQVHVAGTRNVLEVASEVGVRRFIHMSAVGAEPASASGYQRTKGEAENLVRAAGLRHTIVRPSLVFGVGDDFFATTLKQLVTLPPVVPVVGTGAYPFRPVWVEDVASAFVAALGEGATVGRELELVGPKEYTLRELLVMIRDLLRPGKPLVSVPLPLMRLGVTLFKLLPKPPITSDQFLMLLAGNTGDPAAARDLLGLEPARLEEHLPQVLGLTRH